MRKLPIFRVRPGMVLADDVRPAGEAVLLGSGTTLTSEHIDMLTKRKVQIVTVVAEEAQTNPGYDGPLDPAELREQVLIQHRWFGDTREDPVMNELFRTVVRRVAARKWPYHA